ncbi:AMP-binding protein [Achromobacter marplatensis]|jgi:long-chain acyl-CoA synthetase|uniref:AMP-binding protein n=1 Tax=Achromobacter marplatensis TaxID=470868 RepID=A0AA43B377_9BURK|nr:AMP-binding protein [Achromobacter marplatensis]MDH2054018.1 AMP-binding protein [Achromobacter marplatensis]
MHLSSLFQRSATTYADQPALAAGLRTPLTYAGLQARVQALAGWLRGPMGLQAGQRVMLALRNHPSYIESMLAVWHAGLCAVPVNAKLHATELEYILRDCDARLCLSQGEIHAALAPVARSLDAMRVVDVESDDYAAATRGPALPLEQRSPQELAWLFYTSGTTGKPKGVMLSHANLVGMCLNFYADVQAVQPGDAMVHVAPLSHGGGLYSIPYWLHGALQIVPDSGGLDEVELHGLLTHYRNVSLFASPTIVQRMVRHARQAGGPPPGLRALIVGGAPFYIEDIKDAVACFGARVAQIYGQGESPMSISALSASQIAEAVRTNDDALLGSVGYVQTSMDVELRDARGQAVGQDELGEVAVSGPTVMLGYWNNPQATADTVVDGWLHTGDIGLRDARGLLHLKDRSKDVIISGGTNIYPREVEEALMRHDAVREVSVVGAPDPEWGEAVLAFVVLKPGAHVLERDLDQLCLASIARFKRPKRYVFLDELPKNSTGKVLKRELQQHALPTP